jgi:hypothetical protein
MIEHVMMAVKFLIDAMIPDIPRWVIHNKKKYRWLEQHQIDEFIKE